MDVAALRNPYDYANPVSAEDVFAGRRLELSQIAGVLAQTGTGEPVGYVAVHGQRAAGKTSMVNMIELMATQHGHLAVRLDLVPADVGPVAFFTKFYEELVGAVGNLCGPDLMPITPRQVRRIASGSVQDDDFPLEFPENLAQVRAGAPLSEMALRRDLLDLAGRADRPIVVLVDEAQLIADDEDVLSLLRTLGTQLRGFVFVLAGTTELIDRVNVVFDHLLRQFEFVEISRFTETTEIEDCVRRPLEAAGFDGARLQKLEELGSDLMRLTDGNPYEIQLYCHTMFNRWQRGAAAGMKLTADALDDVLKIMDRRREVVEHPVLDVVKALPADRLRALNVLCTGMSKCTLSELTFAHRLYAADAFTPEELERHRDELVRLKVIELENGRVQFLGSLFEQIYARLWTVSKLGDKHHAQLISSLPFDHLLCRQFEYVLCDTVRPAAARMLRTCCHVMDERHLLAGLNAIATLPPRERGSFTVDFLHEAIVHAGIPAALDLTKVTCTFGTTRVVRWITSADSADYDLTADPAFVAFRRHAELLDAVIEVDRTRQPLPSWPELRQWLADTASSDVPPRELRRVHETNGYSAYGRGDYALAVDSLEAAHAISPAWRSANDLAYILLRRGAVEESRSWAVAALALASSATERALSTYNSAIGALVLGADEARDLLDEAGALIESYECARLLVPRNGPDGEPELYEEEDPDLSKVIDRALSFLDARSAGADTVVGRDEAVGPAGS
jgi:hypothetical protein